MASKRHHLAEVLGERSLKATDFKTMAKVVAAYLLETGNTAQLEPLMRDIVAYRADHGVVEVEASSAHDLTSQDIKDIRMLLKAEYPASHSFSIDQSQDPNLVGGIKLSLPGQQLDLTVKAQVNKFKRLTTSGGV